MNDFIDDVLGLAIAISLFSIAAGFAAFTFFLCLCVWRRR